MKYLVLTYYLHYSLRKKDLAPETLAQQHPAVRISAQSAHLKNNLESEGERKSDITGR